jgi:hypothetical protein
VNLAEAFYVLGDYEDALAANDQARALEPTRPSANVDHVLFLLVNGEPWSKELNTIIFTSLRRAPLRARSSALENGQDLIALTLHRPPKQLLQDCTRAGRRAHPHPCALDELRRLEPQLTQFQAVFDTYPPSYGNPGRWRVPQPPATLHGFSLSFPRGDLSALEEQFSYDKVVRSDRRIYFLFVNGMQARVEGPVSWQDPRFYFKQGSGSITHQFRPRGGFHIGDHVRTEIYVDGNLRAVCEFRVSTEPLPSSACSARGASPRASSSGSLSIDPASAAGAEQATG